MKRLSLTIIIAALSLLCNAQIITTIAGTGRAGFSGDGGAATAAMMDLPNDRATDKHGNIYFIDHYNIRIRKVDTAGIITTIAGYGVAGWAGDGGPATAAEIS
jgi:serine/threonine-protein kinase